MPEAVTFHYQNKNHAVYFSHLKACLPIQMKNGKIKLLPWGRRQEEKSDLPLGGWAKLTAVHAGKWNLYRPKPVRLLIEKFMKTDFEGRSHWYEVIKGQWIQGLLAHGENDLRVYIVTISPELLDICHDRWPRIMATV